jgi:sugar transferase (PEP-CTERM/EpsH1 system associated)
MRILVLTSAVPYPPHGGGHARMYQILRYLAREHTVDLLSLATPRDAPARAPLGELCREVVFVPAPPRRVGLRRVTGAVRNLALLRAYEADPRVARAVRAQVATGYDLVQVENGHMIPYVATVPGTPRTLDIFGLGTEGVWRDLAVETELVDRLRAVVARLKARRIERRLSHLFEAAYVVSEKDRAYLQATDPALRTYVVANGVDADYFRPAPEPPPAPVELVFTGAMDYTANEDAALFFHREIYPRVRAQHPDARLSVVGRDPSPRIRALADARVTVTGVVEDTRPYLARATVVLAPIRLGAGTRLKVLEALAMARPVVATRIGAEGLRLTPGQHLEIADDPPAFAAAILRLLGDPDARRRLGREGRLRVEAEYDWKVVLAPLSLAVHETAAARRSPAWRR